MVTKTGKPQVRRVAIFTLEMREDGILHLHADGDHTIDIELYKAMISAVGEMTGGKKVPMLCTADELTIPDEEVRKFMTRPDANPYSLANALIAPSLSQKILSNIFIRIMRPARPIRLFRTREEALAWLRTFLDNN